MKERDLLIKLLADVEYQYCDVHSITRENVVDYLMRKGVTVRKWIPIRDRLPTQNDANENGCILAVHEEDGYGRVWPLWNVQNFAYMFTHWLPFEKFSEWRT